MDSNSTELWRQQKIKQRAIFTARQRLPYEVKIRRQALRAWEFYEKMLSQYCGGKRTKKVKDMNIARIVDRGLIWRS